MASYHCSAKIGGKGSAGKHADYISREGKYSPELTKGTSKLEDLEHTASGNMPTWAEHEAGIFWRAADEYERANGSTYREIEVALPRELTPAQRVALVEDFIAQQIGKNHAFTFAIHKPKAALEGGDQPHCHFMYSERTLDGIDRDPAQYFKRANSKNPERGGCKKASGGKTRHDLKSELLETRKLWATVQNAHLEKYGHTDRVDHRSLKDQGIERQPEAHLGPLVAKQIDATDFIESRRLEHELELAIKAVSSIDVTAELAAQHAAAEQAQREAQAAIAKAAAQAAELAAAQAQMRHLQDLLTATLAKQEKEDDGIRAAAFAKIDGNVRAARASWEGTVSAVGASAGSLNASRRVADGNGKIADRIGRNTEITAKAAERRQLARNLDLCAPAVRDKLGRVDKVLQQVSRICGGIAKTIATACQLAAAYAQAKREIAAERVAAHSPEVQRLDKLIDQLKGLGKPVQAAQAPVKAITPPKLEKPATVVLEPAKAITPAAPEKPPTAVLEPALNDADRKQIARLDDLINRAGQGDQKAMDSLARAFDKLDDAKQAAQADYSRAKPKQFHWPYAEQAAQASREEAAKLDVNAAAAGRGVTAVPYPPGTSGLYTAEHYSSYETALKKATNELGYHSREPRPEGFWKKKETAAHDSKTTDLQSKVTGWQKEIDWRGGALKAASAARVHQDAAHLAGAKAAYDREQAPTAAKAEPLKARSEAHEREHARLRAKIELIFDKEKQHELANREHGMDYGR